MTPMTVTANFDQVKCDRCDALVPDGQYETLLFESQYKYTELELCAACFQSAREVFIAWRENKCQPETKS